MNKTLTIAIICAAAFCAVSCNKTPDEEEIERRAIAADPEYRAKEYLRGEYMDLYYYWYKEVKARNDALKPYRYDDIYQWFDALLYDEDRWSWMEEGEEYLASESGSISGTWGASIIQPISDYNDYGLYVRAIYSGSPFEKYGVTRGAQLRALGTCQIGDEIDSQAEVDYYNNHLYDSPNKFTFRLTNGRDTTFTASLATSLNTDYILKSTVFTSKDFPGLREPVGYINFTSFVDPFIPNLTQALKKIKASGAKKLILDMRYNGGGSSNASDSLMSYIAPLSAVGKPYVVRSHNDKLSKYDQTTTVKKNAGNLDLDAIYFIMHSSSASATEMVYNGLRPYMGSSLHHVGGQSYGKPNGMYVLFYPGDDASYTDYDKGNYSALQYVFYPICFYNKNSKGDVIPSTSQSGSGFQPENSRPDDVYHDFGPEEDDIRACLTHIVTGSYPPVDMSHVITRSGSGHGVVSSLAIPEEQTNPHYGKDLVYLRKH